MSSQVPGCHYMVVLISSDLFAVIPFIFAVLWKLMDTQNQTSQIQYKNHRENNFKYSVGKIVVHKGMLLYSGQWT
jgi:predicted solute-binding protein